MGLELGIRGMRAPAGSRLEPAPGASLRDRLIRWGQRRAFFQLLEWVCPGGTVLDLACGSGQFTELLLARGYTVATVDIARTLCDPPQHPVRIRPGLMAFVHQGDPRRLPFDDREFDGVTCMHLFQHVARPARQELLKEVRRVGRTWALLAFRASAPRTGSQSTAQRRLVGGSAAASFAGMRHDLAAAGMTIVASERVFPFLTAELVVLVTW